MQSVTNTPLPAVPRSFHTVVTLRKRYIVPVVGMSLQQERETQVQVVRQTLLRIAGHKGVVGYMVLNPKDGSIVECVGFNNDRKLTEAYADKLFGFVHLAQSTVRTLSNEDDLTFLRMRWRLREILIAPDLNKEFMLVVVQDQTTEGELLKGQDIFADK